MIEVKELFWTEFPNGLYCSEIGREYTIRWADSNGPFQVGCSPGCDLCPPTATLEAAKAACQSDFARRILPHVEAVSEAKIQADERERMARWFEEYDSSDFDGAQIGHLVRAQEGGQ